MKTSKIFFLATMLLAMISCEKKNPENTTGEIPLLPTVEYYQLKTYTFDTDEQAQISYGLIDVLKHIKPLWGFLIYDIYALALQLSGMKVEHYWAELIAAIITLVLVIQTVMAEEQTNGATNQTGFAKVLAAHSFSWIGVQTMFVFIFAFTHLFWHVTGSIILKGIW